MPLAQPSVDPSILKIYSIAYLAGFLFGAVLFHTLVVPILLQILR
jgi:hypothetical protein